MPPTFYDKGESMRPLQWNQPQNIPSKSYTYGYCGNPLASEKGWGASIPATGDSALRIFVYICHRCTRPTFIDEDNKQSPGVVFGNAVNDIPEESVRELYNEARK